MKLSLMGKIIVGIIGAIGLTYIGATVHSEYVYTKSTKERDRIYEEELKRLVDKPIALTRDEQIRNQMDELGKLVKKNLEEMGAALQEMENEKKVNG